jgi:hypothetical protein
MIVNFQGREWSFDEDRVTVDQYREVKRKYGLTAKAQSEGVNEGDPDALTCLYWFMQTQSGQPDAILSDKINFEVGPLYTAINDANVAEAQAQAAREKAELEAAAEKEAELARLVPTSPGGPALSGLPSRPDTTLMPLDAMEAARAPSSTGSGTGTSSSSGPTTSSSSPGSAGSATATSGG